jgi:hypothetical protein
MAPHDKERFDALMKLSDFRFARWQNRRGIEWKMSYAFWATLVSAATYQKLSDLPIPLCLIAAVLIIAVVLHAHWIRTNWISNQMDILTAFHFAEHAEKILELDGSPKPKKRLDPDEFRSTQGCFTFLKEGACQAQFFTTVFLAVVLLLILAYPAIHKGTTP